MIEHHKRQVLQASYDYFAASADCEKLMVSIAQDFAANEITATVLKSERNRRVHEYQCGLDFTSITAVRRFPGTKKKTTVHDSHAKQKDAAHDSHANQKEFANLFMNSEPAVLKKRYDADSLYKNLVDFEANLKEPLAKLKEYQERLRKMHGMYTC